MDTQMKRYSTANSIPKTHWADAKILERYCVLGAQKSSAHRFWQNGGENKLQTHNAFQERGSFSENQAGKFQGIWQATLSHHWTELPHPRLWQSSAQVGREIRGQQGLPKEGRKLCVSGYLSESVEQLSWDCQHDVGHQKCGFSAHTWCVSKKHLQENISFVWKY